MTITLDLRPEIERGLMAQAQAKGVSLIDYAQEVLAREVPQAASANVGPTSQAKNLFELFAPIRGLLTDDEIDRSFSRNRFR